VRGIAVRTAVSSARSSLRASGRDSPDEASRPLIFSFIRSRNARCRLRRYGSTRTDVPSISLKIDRRTSVKNSAGL
jgi:hypothetical protein